MSKLIGEGGYGCVYYPNFDCKGKITPKKYVSKIQLLNKNIKREIDIGKLIIKIPHYNIYFAPIIKSCIINYTLFSNKHLLENCEIINNNKNKKFVLSNIDYINGFEFKKYLISITDNNIYIILLLNNYYYLLNSLQILSENNICHYDIKFENIIYNINNNKSIIIDFGLSFLFTDIENFSSLNKFFYIYAPTYYIWCPEIQIISFIVNNNNSIFTKYTLNIILEEIVEGMNIWNVFNIDFKKQYLNDLYIYYSQFINKDNNYIISELLKYKYSWDCYALNISCLKELILKISNIKDIDNNRSIIFIIIKLLLYSLHPDPSKRASIYKLKEILYTTFNKNFSNSLKTQFLNFSLNDDQHNYIINEIIPKLYFFI